MKVQFAGDIHGNERHLEWVYAQADRYGVEAVIACGDFGYWPHYRNGIRFLKAAERLALETDIPLYWVPGNHENWDLIDEAVAQHGAESWIPTQIGPRASQHLRLIPRGGVVELGDARILGVGGAWSVDWQHRILGESWWPQEVLTDEIVAGIAARVGQVDILVTHDAPLGVELSYKDDLPVSVAQRELVARVLDHHRPVLNVCGHHHRYAEWHDERSGAEVRVLACDDKGDDSILIIEADDWTHASTVAA